MEATSTDLTAYMLGRLDTIIDRQAELKALITQVLTLMEQPRPAVASATTTRTRKQLFSRMRNMSPFWQSMVAGGLFWIIGICTRSYLNRGGDPMALIELIVKSVL
jgi:hypothetical protein